MNSSWRKKYLRNKSYYLNVAAQYRKRADIRAYLEILLSLITVIIFAIFALRPTLITIAELIREIDAKKATVAKMDAKIQHLATAQALFDQQRNNILLLNSAVPERPAPDSFSRQIEGLSNFYETTVSSISLGEASILGKVADKDKNKKENVTPLPENAEGYEFSVGAVTIVDQYASLYNLLTDFEKLRRPAKIDNINFTISKEEDVEKLNLTINGRLPYLKKEK
jgi:hypothetical protein